MFSCCLCLCPPKEEITVSRGKGITGAMMDGEILTITSNSYEKVLAELFVLKQKRGTFHYYIHIENDKRLENIADMQAFVNGLKLYAKIGTLYELSFTNCKITDASAAILAANLAAIPSEAINQIKQIVFEGNSITGKINTDRLKRTSIGFGVNVIMKGAAAKPTETTRVANPLQTYGATTGASKDGFATKAAKREMELGATPKRAPKYTVRDWG